MPHVRVIHHLLHHRKLVSDLQLIHMQQQKQLHITNPTSSCAPLSQFLCEWHQRVSISSVK